MATYKLNSIDVTVEGVTRTFNFGDEGPVLGDFDSDHAAQRGAYRHVLDVLETTET